MKKYKIIFWVTTGLIFLLEGVMSAFTGHSEMSITGIASLGYPIYFVTVIVVFKVLGSLALIIPQVPPRVKEWAYAGFGIDFLCAFISIWIVGGFSSALALPVIALVVLVLSYISYHKLHPVFVSDLPKIS
ncbi:DoxX family protein [Candidatus Nomurabacteria bacterium]|nr:MAG: DoxX family protein [Candidatus Nomurabacteria bacterium]